MPGTWCSRIVLLLAIAAATITVVSSDLPSLEILPDSPEITKPVGQSLALTCRPVVQDPKLVTQLEWRDNKNRRIDNTNSALPVYKQPLHGETGLVLILSKLTENLAGEYGCHAQYANTETLVKTVRVNTIVDITWVDAPESQYPILGKDYLIRCEVRANPAPIVDWMRNSQAIVSDDRHIVESHGLLLKNVKEADDGVYTCRAVVVSTGQIAFRVIRVEVQVPPTIMPMDTVAIIEGESASVQCNGTGKPPPSFNWIKEDTRQDLSITDRFDVKKTTGLLIINRVELNDNSLYKCIAENQAGRTESKVKINVLQKPKIYELLNVTAPIRNETRITCKAEGRPAPLVLFKKVSTKELFEVGLQRSDKRIILENFPDESKGQAFGTLIISHLNRTDDGLYECIAENNVGAAYKNGHITVEFPPTFEKTKDYPPIWTWDNRPGNLSCIAESIPNATIRWRLAGTELQDRHPVFRIEGHGPQSNLIVTPYHEQRYFTNYECQAFNRLGEASLLIELRQATVPGVMQQVKIGTLTATTVKFSIVGPPNFNGLPMRSYIAQYVNERDRTYDVALNKTWSIDAPYIVENLVPLETYRFRFAARNDVGQGGWTNIPNIMMPRRSAPAEPRILVSDSDLNEPTRPPHANDVVPDRVANSPYADHFELRWNVPNDNGDPIESYRIRYCVTRRINGQWRDSVSECSSEIQVSYQYNYYELNDLSADTAYKIELRAVNAIGASSPAQIRVKTARGIDTGTGMYIPNDLPISSGAIIGIVVGVVIAILIIVDLTCYCAKRAGILALICARGKSIDEEDPKLGRDEKEPLNTTNQQPNNGNARNIAVEYDGKNVYSKTVEIGRHSAV